MVENGDCKPKYLCLELAVSLIGKSDKCVCVFMGKQYKLADGNPYYRNQIAFYNCAIKTAEPYKSHVSSIDLKRSV